MEGSCLVTFQILAQVPCFDQDVRACVLGEKGTRHRHASYAMLSREISCLLCVGGFVSYFVLFGDFFLS